MYGAHLCDIASKAIMDAPDLNMPYNNLVHSYISFHKAQTFAPSPSLDNSPIILHILKKERK